jgi:DNA-binding MarR family transcriptional regulator
MVESDKSRPTGPALAGVAAFRDLASSLDLLDQVAAVRLGIGRSDLRCLDALSRRGPLPAGALAEAVGLSAPALSAALNRLEKVDYIRREHDQSDRRTVRVTLTESAAKVTASLFTQVHTETTRLLGALDPSDLVTITRITNALTDTIQTIAARNTPPGTPKPRPRQ